MREELLSRWPWRGPLIACRSMRDIIEEIAARHGLTVEELRSGRRIRRISWPRQEAMAEMHEAGFSNMQAARYVGLRDHTSCNHARKAVAERRALAQQEVA